MKIECLLGPVTVNVGGSEYTFSPDEDGRFVAEVWIPKHADNFLSVVHYRRIGADDPLEPPVLDDIDPDSAEIGGEDVTLTCTGSYFTPDSIIVFNGGDEPTTFISDTELTTTVKPSTASLAGDYPVLVRNATGSTEPLDFTFTEAGTPARAARAKRVPKSKPQAKARKS